MPTAQCLANIKAEKPPFNISCTDQLCQEVSAGLNQHCATDGLPLNTPQISYDPYIKKTCYCCCSCYALDTPIEASKGEFVLIQDIQKGDSILTAGIDLKWKPGTVASRSGSLDKTMIPGLYLVHYIMPGEKEPRELLVTSDHLFLMYSSNTLKKVQHLIPGNKLMTADKKAAEVVFALHGEHNTAVQTINMKGNFDGKDLTGHLINANGVVSTDYKVQAYYEHKKIDDKLTFAFTDEDVHEVGTPEYSEKFPSSKRDAFIDDPQKWPKGFNPKRKPLVNVPHTAKAFLTVEQAGDIADKSKFNPYSNSSSRDTIIKLFNMLSAWNSKVQFILDWDRKDVNAYAWMSGNQKFVLLTGGLARIEGMYVDGFSLIIADMMIRLTNPSHECVAEGDYYSLDVLRGILPSTLFASMAPEGITQVEEVLLNKIGEEHQGGEPVCSNPSVDCRKQAFWNGLSFMPIPQCAVPLGQFFYLVKAYASYDLKTVNVVFDVAVDAATAESLINYSIQSGVEITSAKVDEMDPKNVILSVSGLAKGNRYILSITNVTSAENQPLSGEAYTILAIE